MNQAGRRSKEEERRRRKKEERERRRGGEEEGEFPLLWYIQPTNTMGACCCSLCAVSHPQRTG